jgi:hypothetical protein
MLENIEIVTSGVESSGAIAMTASAPACLAAWGRTRACRAWAKCVTLARRTDSGSELALQPKTTSSQGSGPASKEEEAVAGAEDRGGPVGRLERSEHRFEVFEQHWCLPALRRGPGTAQAGEDSPHSWVPSLGGQACSHVPPGDTGQPALECRRRVPPVLPGGQPRLACGVGDQKRERPFAGASMWSANKASSARRMSR